MKRDTLILVGIALAALVIGVVVFLSDRGGVPDTSSVVANTQPSAVAVPFTQITRGQKSTVAARVNYLITSAEELAKLWKMVDATPPPPAIDFKKQAVLAVFAGSEPSTSISVAKVEDADRRVVSITLTKQCGSSESAPSSYEIVAVPATTLPLTHEDLATTASCPN